MGPGSIHQSGLIDQLPSRYCSWCDVERDRSFRAGRPAAVRAAGVAPGAVAAAAGAGAQRSGRVGADDAGRRAAEPRVVPPAPAPRWRPGVRPPQLGGPPRQLLHDRSRRLPRGAARRRRCAPSRAAPRSRCRRPVAASGGTRRRRRVLFLCTGNSARSQIAEALLEHMSAGTVEARSAGSHPKPLHPNAVRVLRRRGIDISATPHQAPRRVRLRALRRRDHPVRPRSRGVPGVPVPPRARALEHPRPGARGIDGPRLVPRLRAHRRRARAAHRLPAPPVDRPSNDEEVHPCRTMRPSTSATWSSDVEASIAFYTELLGFELLTSAAPAFADVKRGNLRLLLAGPKSSAGRPMPDGATPGPGRLEPDPLHRRRPRRRGRTAPRRRRDVPQRRRRRPGRQADPAQDPSGNVVELFQPAAR